MTDSQIDLLTFRFSMGGGQFVVEVGSVPPAGSQLYGRLVPAPEVKIHHLLRRLRLGATDESRDHWFNFESGDYGGVAASVVPYIRGQAVEWWARAEPDAAPERQSNQRW